MMPKRLLLLVCLTTPAAAAKVAAVATKLAATAAIEIKQRLCLQLSLQQTQHFMQQRQ
jgi:hypothetical protein